MGDVSLAQEGASRMIVWKGKVEIGNSGPMDVVAQILLQAAIFALILTSYFFALKASLQAPFLILGMVVATWDKFRHRKQPLWPMVTMVRIESVLISVFAALFLMCFFLFDLFQYQWFILWKSPPFLAVVLLVFVHQASQLKSYMPFLRAAAAGTMLISWLVGILVLIGYTAPELIAPETFKWAAASSGVLVLISGAISLFYFAPKFQTFVELDERHDSIGQSLKNLQHIANLIGDAHTWKSVREAITNVDHCYSEALKHLRKNKLEQADAFIVQAETDATQVEETFRDRMRLSLRDELRARLTQATSDVSSLSEELEGAGLSARNLEELSSQIPLLTGKLEELEFTTENLLNQLGPFEATFREIVDTRTALRFRRNVDSTIDPLREEVEEKSLLLQLGRQLGLETSEAETRKQAVNQAFDTFQSGPANSSRQLLNSYQSFQKTLTAFRVSVAALALKINRNWNAEVIDSGPVSVYMPKSCSTTDSVRAAVIVKFKGSNCPIVSFDLDATLLELPAKRTVTLDQVQGKRYALSHFTFAGKRGGKGTLTLSSRNSECAGSHSFDIRVTPSVGEAARDALVFATPIGGVAILALWGLGISSTPTGWAGIGLAVGGTAGLLIFLATLLKHRRR